MKPTVEIPPRKYEENDFNHNNKEEYSYDSDTNDPYASDHFRMFEFKIRRCTRSRSHDWTDCPFAHPGEKARRRDPRRFQYSGEVCPEFRRSNGDCSRGDDCEFAHGVFECWLHPIHYRTEACKDGKHCKRKVCFFAHSPRQLRVLPPPIEETKKKNILPCCLFCSSDSPKSTLLSTFSRSPSQSPPVHKSAAFSRLRDRFVLNELVNSLDSMSLAEVLQETPVSASQRLQFVRSPCTPSYLTNLSPRRRQMNDFTTVDTVKDNKASIFEDGSCGEIDLGWVNDLLT